MTDDPFVTPAWLADRLEDPLVLPIDGSWYLPAQNRQARAEFEAGHIPGAIFFDIDAMSDARSDLPHMLPDAADFSEKAGALGISSHATLVVYDGLGLFSAPRVWWTLRLFGAKRVLILAGGLPRWRQEGQPLEAGPSRRPPATFAARTVQPGVASLDDVRRALADGGAQVLDARPAARFRGEVPEPRPGVRSGHMPGSLSLPFSDLVADGALRDLPALRATLDAAGVDLGRPVIASCGSGVSAAILVMALERLGASDVRLYDGSWADYGSHPELPVATGA